MPDLLSTLPIPLTEQIAEVERECASRRTFYHWLRGHYERDVPTTAEPKRRWLVMEAALGTLRRVGNG